MQERWAKFVCYPIRRRAIRFSGSYLSCVIAAEVPSPRLPLVNGCRNSSPCEYTNVYARDGATPACIQLSGCFTSVAKPPTVLAEADWSASDFGQVWYAGIDSTYPDLDRNRDPGWLSIS